MGNHERGSQIINRLARGHEVTFIKGAGGVAAWEAAIAASKRGDIVGTAAQFQASRYPGVDHGISGDYKIAFLAGAYEAKAGQVLRTDRRKAQRLLRRAHEIYRMDY